MQTHRNPEALAAEAKLAAMNARYVREHRLRVPGPPDRLDRAVGSLTQVWGGLKAAVLKAHPEIDAGDDYLNGVPTHY